MIRSDNDPAFGWAIVAEDGLWLWTNLSQDEAESAVREHPVTPNGTPQIAVPKAVAQMLSDERQRLANEAERALKAEQQAAVRRILHNHAVTEERKTFCARALRKWLLTEDAHYVLDGAVQGDLPASEVSQLCDDFAVTYREFSDAVQDTLLEINAPS